MVISTGMSQWIEFPEDRERRGRLPGPLIKQFLPSLCVCGRCGGERESRVKVGIKMPPRFLAWAPGVSDGTVTDIWTGGDSLREGDVLSTERTKFLFF